MIAKTNQQCDPAIGFGVYNLAEVARYTQLHNQRVRAWFNGRDNGSSHGRVLQSDYRPIKKSQAVSFHDLIDVLVAGQFRELGVSLQVVRAAYSLLQTRFEARHPFCHRDLYTDGKQIFLRTAAELGDSVLSEVVSNQQFFSHVCEYLTQVEYGEASALAERWCIAEGIVIDPQVSLGKPVIKGTGITSFVVANAYVANHADAALVADLFDIDEAAVLGAAKFERDYGTLKAA